MQKNENRPGYKNTKVGWIPEGWDAQKLGNQLAEKPCYGINAPAVEYSESLPTYLRITDISENGYFIEEGKASVDSKNSAEYYLQEGDLVFARTGASTGKTYLYNPHDGDLVFAGFLIRARPSKKKLNSYFLKAYTATHAYWNWISVTSTRSGQPGVNGNEYAGMNIPLPPLPEQEAIAGALECWDKAIRKLELKIGKKRNIKKGLMQRLLSGKTRLPGFSKVWKTVRLGEVLAEKPQYGINAPSVPFSEDLPTYLRITDISEDGRFLDESKTSVDHPDSESYVLSSGDLVFARTGASTGKAFLYSSNHGKLIFAGFLIRISTDRNRLEPAFLKFYTETHDYWNWINVMSTRSGQPGINGQEYAQLQIPFPSLEEQQAIAEVLGAADREIEALERKLDKWRDQKKYLLNNLVTGTIRLPEFRTTNSH